MDGSTSDVPVPSSKSAALPPRAVIRDNIVAALEKLPGQKRSERVLSATGGRSLLLSAVAEGRPVQDSEHEALAAELLQKAREALDRQPAEPITVGGFVDNDD